jgi:hypothetical protein
MEKNTGIRREALLAGTGKGLLKNLGNNYIYDKIIVDISVISLIHCRS